MTREELESMPKGAAVITADAPILEIGESPFERWDVYSETLAKMMPATEEALNAWFEAQRKDAVARLREYLKTH